MRALLLVTWAAALSVSTALAGIPPVCTSETGVDSSMRAPQSVSEYLRALGQDPFDLRVACAKWAGNFSHRHQALAERKPAGGITAARFILFPGDGFDVRRLTVWLSHDSQVRAVERAQRFVVAELDRRVTTAQLTQLL